ncbi:MAG: UvrD-helicase domain-containing protein, partial [Burkholderiales bacterium]|nr:UvrD-helicase domain-containing protein [Burkholderiales bacterium]
LLVIAGAGSGKTSVIASKIAYLINEYNYDPKHITAITFTNKAAKEMLERTNKLLIGTNTRGLTITTFHSLGFKILKKECHLLGYKPTFSILDSYDSYKIISDIIKTADKATIKSTQNQISLWKNQLLSPSQLLTIAENSIDIAIAQTYQQYQDTLKTYQSMDFDDLIKLPLELFESNVEILYKWQQKIRYLLIDEYQDTNECQYRLVKLLVSRSGLFTAVGDDDQSIYAWRGADLNNLRNLKNDFPQLKVIKLEQNYRSTATILTAANNIIKNNTKIFDKKLWSELGHGDAINIITCQNDDAEADTIVRKIMLHHLQNGSRYSDYAILYRGNHQARIFEQVLRNYQLPYTISGGQSFFEKTEIKDIFAYLRLLLNEDDDTAFIRALTTPKRGIGQVTLDKLANYATKREISLFRALFEEGFTNECNANQLNELAIFGNFINNLQFRLNKEEPTILLNELISSIKYEEYLYDSDNPKNAEKRYGNVLNLIKWLEKKSLLDNKKLPELIQTINLISILDGQEEKEVNNIKLSTIHAAKGLEYPYLYLISCEEGIIPHQESINNNTIEEERRLMYVAITRAQRELTISHCQQRKQGGALQTKERSRFIEEIGDNNIIDELKRSKSKPDNKELKNRLQSLQDLLK